ncbi:MAG: urease accessory protein UreF [Sneathiella sp.]|nr:MAG: urease accessory protein UreF [Sneathiella sp.]
MDNKALFHLMSWMSPSYPVGAYTYSHGIEYAVEAGLLKNVDELVVWITDILVFGSGKSDSAFLAATYAEAISGTLAGLCDIAELGQAFSSTRELALETEQQGRAFIRVISDVSPSPGLGALQKQWQGPIISPIAVAIVAADNNIPLAAVLTAYLHGFVSNLVSAAVRLVPLGQTDGQRAIAALAQTVEETVRAAQNTTLEDMGTATLMVDWCSSKHETQYTRLFRS